MVPIARILVVGVDVVVGTFFEIVVAPYGLGNQRRQIRDKRNWFAR
jgi:hypothetical protein